MYNAVVSCSNCHEPPSAKLRAHRNALLRVNCHMPPKTTWSPTCGVITACACHGPICHFRSPRRTPARNAMPGGRPNGPPRQWPVGIPYGRQTTAQYGIGSPERAESVTAFRDQSLGGSQIIVGSSSTRLVRADSDLRATILRLRWRERTFPLRPCCGSWCFHRLAATRMKSPALLVVRVATSTGNGRRLATVLASRNIVNWSFTGLPPRQCGTPGRAPLWPRPE
jgi:hypothetical protein